MDNSAVDLKVIQLSESTSVGMNLNGELTTYSEADPEVGANTTNYLPKWDGSALVQSTSVFEDGSGNVGIGENTPNHPLHMGSGAHCTTAGVWTNASDRRLKTSIVPLGYGLGELLALHPVSYRMKSNGEEQIGFIAQEVRELLPELVSGTEGDMDKGETLGLSYGNLTALLVKAVQEQQKIIENGKLGIENLKALSEEQQAEMKNLQSQLTEMEELKQRVVRLESALLDKVESTDED